MLNMRSALLVIPRGMKRYRFSIHSVGCQAWEDAGSTILPDDDEARAFGAGIISDLMVRDAYAGWVMEIVEGARTVCSIEFSGDDRLALARLHADGFRSWLHQRWTGTPAALPVAPARFDDGLVELLRLIGTDDPVKAPVVSDPPL
jgi:hypothetical protein